MKETLEIIFVSSPMIILLGAFGRRYVRQYEQKKERPEQDSNLRRTT